MPTRTTAVQVRSATGGTSATSASLAGMAPRWVRLTRRGNTFTSLVSIDFVTWTQVGSIAVDLTFSCFTGLAFTSHNTTTTGTAFFDDVAFSN